MTTVRPTPPASVVGTIRLINRAEIERWIDAIAVIESHAEGSCDRHVAVEMVAKLHHVHKATVYRRLERYRTGGDLALCRKKPATSGRPRVVMSRKFDRCVDNPETLAAIAAEFDKVLASYSKTSLARMGSRKLAMLLQLPLFAIVEKHGLEGAVPKAACLLPRKRIQRFRHLQIVDTYKRDRKKFSDQLPRIRRSWDGLLPMEIVVVDVKHLDLVIARDDGTLAYPKMITWLDMGTRRARSYLVVPEERGKVTKADVAAAFIEMATDAKWGVPYQIITDRGRENGCLEVLRDSLNSLRATGTEAILKTRPYSPQSKPVEGWFSEFDAFAIQHLQGYLGPDRTNKKTEKVGKPTEPFADGVDALRSVITCLVENYNHWPSSGARGGKSPEEVFAEALDRWSPTLVDPLHIEAAFCEVRRARIKRGSVRVNGASFTHPEIQAAAGINSVEIAIPWRSAGTPMFRLSLEMDWTALHPDVPFPALDQSGITEAALRRRRQIATVRKLDRSAADVDPVKILAGAKLTPSSPVPMRRRPPLDMGDEARRLAASLAQNGNAPVQPPDIDEWQIQDARQTARRLGLDL